MKRKMIACLAVILLLCVALVPFAVSAVAEHKAVCENCGLLGDHDGNGVVNLDDAIYLLYHVNFPEKYPLTGAGAAPSEPTPLYAGFAERDFTPTEMGGNMPGASYPVIAKKVEMPLFANAAAFESDSSPLIIVSVDMLRLGDADCEEMKKRIEKETSVLTDCIMIVATHTHSGVGLNYQHNQNPPNVEGYNHMMDMAVEAAVEAWNTRERAKMGFGKTELEGYSFCREAFLTNGDVKTWPTTASKIDRLIGTPDQSVNVIRVDGADDKTKCFVINYANHPDTSSKSGYNSDYPGYLRKKLKETYGEDIVVVYLNGAEGDVNNYDYLNSTKVGNNSVIGYALADAVIALNPSITATEEYPEIRVKFQKHAMVQEKPTAEQIEWAKKTMAKIEAGESVANLDKKYAMEYTGMDYSALPELHDVEIQTVVLGDFAMVALPFEAYSELGWRIREQSPYENTFVVGQANASYGYIGPGFIYGTSSYGARYSYYTARFSRGGGDLLVKYSVEMLKEIKEAK